MLLVIDVGNSETSFGVYDAEKCVRHWRVQTSRLMTADEVASFFFPLAEQSGLKPQSWSGCCIATVVPNVGDSLREFADHYLGLKIITINHQMNLGFELNVDEPHSVGADRLANVAYAVKSMSLPCIVIDVGTATTLDVISKDRVYEGGVILPGIKMSSEVLSDRTAKLPRVSLDFPDKVIGKTTVACLQSGLLYGYCDMLDGLVDRIEKELGTRVSVVLTGGFAPRLKGRLRHIADAIPQLTLDGICLLYLRNI